MTATKSTCRLCGEPVRIDGEGVATHRDGLGSHPAEPLVEPECSNEAWAAENGESVEWARTMWWCPCDDCLTVGLTASSGTCFGEQVRLRPVSPDVSRQMRGRTAFRLDDDGAVPLVEGDPEMPDDPMVQDAYFRRL